MPVAPGSKISVKIVAAPSNEAARKTLLRICGADPQMRRELRTRHDKRPSLQSWRRGGRPWEHRMRSKPAVRLDKGCSYALRATVDVLRDLESVKRFVAVSPA